jgi:hypothetical protein
MNHRVLWPVVIATSLLFPGDICGQTLPQSGLYQIISGSYTECCGIAGDLTYSLPSASQSFVKLAVDPQRNLATMTFLGQDMETVFSVDPCLLNHVIPFSFSSGLIFPDHIVFHVDPSPPPYQTAWNYTVSNSTATLRIAGTLGIVQPPCVDIPNQFTHSNIVATPVLSSPTIRVSELEVCWGSASNVNYQVQYRSALTTNVWTNLGSPRLGNGSNDCITDKVQPGQPQRFYRVAVVP